MQLKTLLFNRGIYTQNNRSVGWIGIAYFLCLTFALPLQILMIATNERKYKYIHHALLSDNLFRISEPFQLILMFTIPVLVGIFLFRYMQVKLSADYIHSLPIKRSALFHQNLVYGIFLVTIPVVLTGVSLIVISGFVDAPQLLNIKVISQWVGSTILFTLFVLMCAVFVAMFTGISVFQGVLTYILFVFPAGILVLFFMNVKYFLYGFAVDYYLHNQMDKMIPFVRAGNLRHDLLTGKEIAIILGLIFGAYVIALVAYHKRKVETATQAITFKILQPVFLYGVTFCTMLVGGMYFGETQGTFGWRIFGYITASILGYFIALMILEKSWRVFTKWKGYSLFLVAMVLVSLFIKFDITGYENRIPAIEKIDQIYFGESLYMMDERRFYSDIHEYPYSQRFYFEDEKNIENIRLLHEEMLKEKRRYDRFSGHYRQVIFGYELKNGRKIVRQYYVPTTFYSQPNPTFSRILESEEYKWNTHGALRIDDVAQIDKISINSNRGMHHLTITNRANIESFHEIVKAELLAEKAIEITDEAGSWATIEYLMKNNQRVYINWKKSHDKIEAWLEERDLIKQARLTADDISFAFVIRKDQEYLWDYMRYEKEMEQFENRADGIRIDDDEQLEQCLKVSNWSDSGEFVIAYYLKNQHTTPFFETISATNAPSFIKDRLQ